MGAAPAEDVDVELVGLGEEEVGLGGDEGEALDEADAQGAVGDDLRERQRRRLDVKAPLDDLEVRRDRPQVLVRVLVRQVAEAQRLPDLARRQELLELGPLRVSCNARASWRMLVGWSEPFAVCRAPGLVCAGPRLRG